MTIYRFGDFTLEPAAFELRRDGQPVKIERRPLDLLILLVQQAGRVVTREEIIAALWPPNVIIDFDSGLNTLVRKVRAALDDSPEQPGFLETVPGRGYRFIAAVRTDSPAPIAEATPPKIEPVAIENRPSVAVESARRTWLLTALAVAAVAIGAFVWLRPAEPTIPSRIAVLPFENLTDDEQLAYLASGLAEETSTTLARVDVNNLRVVSVGPRANLSDFGTALDVGRKLAVDFIVTSTLQKDGGRIRVTPRLLRVADGEQLWTAAFDRELTNILGLQRELSIAIAEQIRLRLSPAVAAAIRARQTENPAAYALYLKGRFEWSQATPASTQRALDYYTQATEMDPSYGLAWAEKAFTAASSLRTVDADPSIAIPLARQALDRALALAPNLAETQYALGYFHLFCERDMNAAEAAARAAIRLDPNNSQAHMLLGVTLSVGPRLTEARDMMRRSRELDPLFALAFANSALVALQSEDPKSALDLARQAVAINPELWVGHYYLGRALGNLGDTQGALDALGDATRLSEGHSMTYTARIRLLTKMGRTSELPALAEEMSVRAHTRYLPLYPLAALYAQLKDKDAALYWLNHSVERKEFDVVRIDKDPVFADLRSDARYAELLRRCNCVPPRQPPSTSTTPAPRT